jgi:hypothetical protein
MITFFRKVIDIIKGLFYAGGFIESVKFLGYAIANFNNINFDE